MAEKTIEGAVFVIDGDVDTDQILAPRHLASTEPAALAQNCFADLTSAIPFEPARYPIVISTGLFGTGLVRPPVPLALRAAGVEVVLAQAVSPLFFEHSLNSGALLPIETAIANGPATGAMARLSLGGGQARLTWDGGEISLPSRLPSWSLQGASWIDIISQRAAQTGGLAMLQARLRAADISTACPNSAAEAPLEKS